ncbi:hypothetical protein ACFWBH_24815 [Streptomyces sp. NPDC059999]|uniref:hypothetical protein n=1 Tax=Streptomyces sp. NPDC059999 TaxID=3347030 RepID=UPI0036766D02
MDGDPELGQDLGEVFDVLGEFLGVAAVDRPLLRSRVGLGGGDEAGVGPVGAEAGEVLVVEQLEGDVAVVAGVVGRGSDDTLAQAGEVVVAAQAHG